MHPTDASPFVRTYRERLSSRAQLTEADALRLTRTHFALDATAAAVLDGYDDRNFRITLADGTHVLLKAHNALDSALPQLVEAQASLLAQLSETSLPFETPRPYPAHVDDSAGTDGTPCFVSRPTLPTVHGDARPIALRVTSFISGPIMRADALTQRETLAQTLGATVATLADALASIPLGRRTDAPPGLSRSELAWDLARFPALRPFALTYLEGEQRAQALEVLDRFDGEVVPDAPQFSRGLVHGDVNNGNLVMDPSRPNRIAGVIDFGDTVWSYRVAELAIALGYAMINAGPSDALATAEHVLRGFAGRGARPLSVAEVKHLPTLAIARIAQSATLGAFAMAMQPENARYLSVHSEPAWAVLRHLLQTRYAAELEARCHDAMGERAIST